MSWDEMETDSATLDARATNEPYGEMGLFHASLSRFCNADMPMPRALECLGDELTRGGLRDECAAMAREVESGQPFAEVYAKRESRFPAVYRALVDVGLRAGDLSGVLREISVDASLRERVREQLRRRLEYPLIATLVVFVLGVALVLLVAPIYESPIPAAAEVESRTPWFIGIGIGLVALLCASAVVFGLIRKPLDAGAGPRGLRFRLPLIGRLHALAAKAGFASMLALLIRRGIPLPRSLELCAAASDSQEVRGQIERMATVASGGAGLGESVRAGDLIPSSLLWFVESAGASEDGSRALEDIASVYRQRLGRATDRVAMFAVPIVELLIGLIVLGFAFAYVVPAYEMYESLFRGFRIGL